MHFSKHQASWIHGQNKGDYSCSEDCKLFPCVFWKMQQFG